jgi:hypothetical protein
MFSSKGESVCFEPDCSERAECGQHGRRRCRVHHNERRNEQRRKKREQTARTRGVRGA